jgi:transcriptional regulator of arginine metabolism
MTDVAKRKRQRAILALVHAEAIHTQAELVDALERRGFEVTQATLSRDLRELRVTRIPTESGYRYWPAGEGGELAEGAEAAAAAAMAAAPGRRGSDRPAARGSRARHAAASSAEARAAIEAARLETTEIRANETLVLVRTLVGRAQGVAVTIDRLRIAEALGSIAGDDTIVVIPRRVKEVSKLRKRLAELLGLD